jgi:hypothetical protein
MEVERMAKRQAQTKKGTPPLAVQLHLLLLQKVQVASRVPLTGSVQSAVKIAPSKRELGHNAAEVSSV